QSGDGAAAGGGGRRGGGPGPGGRGEGAAGLPGGAGVGQRRVRGPVCAPVQDHRHRPGGAGGRQPLPGRGGERPGLRGGDGGDPLRPAGGPAAAAGGAGHAVGADGMKWWICLTALVLALTTSAAAADLPAELERAAPEAAEDLTGGDLSGGTGFAQGVGNILDRLADQVGDVVRERTRGAAAVLLVVVLCGVVEGFAQGTGGKGAAFLPMAGALSITLASAGSLDSLMGLGSRTIGELADFSQALLPTLAAATAASGAVTTATVQQVSTVFFVDLLLRLIRQLLLPLVYLYIGLLTAAACLPENRLGAIAEALKKLVTWILTTALLVFTIYLSIVRIISGSADSATVKVAKAAISGVVPVVGGIIADASETVLAGAGMLKNTIGVFGMLAILAACAYP
ncbi:Phosphoglycerate kinase, partial [Dysosmobacter welbionis]